MWAWRASALVVLLNWEQGRKSQILLVLMASQEGDFVITGQKAEGGVTGHEGTGRALAVERKVKMKQT